MTRIAPMNMGTAVPMASTRRKPDVLPPSVREIWLKKNALRPKPARTDPVADARNLSGNDLATAFMPAARPAEPAAPVMNMDRISRPRSSGDAGVSMSSDVRIGRTPR